MLPICSFIIEIRDGPVPVVDYDGLMVDTERRAQTKSMKLIARIRMLNVDHVQHHSILCCTEEEEGE